MLDYLSNTAVPEGFYEFDSKSPTPRWAGPGTHLLFSVRGNLIAQCYATTSVEKREGRVPRIGIRHFKALLGFYEKVILKKERGRGVYYPNPNERKRLERILRLKSIASAPRRIKAHLKSAETKSRDFQQWLKREELIRFSGRCILCDTNVKSLSHRPCE